ncbi:MAG TPA: hypothetical protein VGQ57_02155, partial [Polyangiaceae bacterium]|nr:hypothetical protein [Polyangiaceae bacterium]
ADDLWQTTIDPASPPLGDAEVAAFMDRYELRGAPASAHPELGVLPTDELVFGALPDSSLTDGKLAVFVIDSNGAGDGYLCSWCGDKAVLHLDALALGSLHTDKTLSIAAHESFHAIHRAYDRTEEVWVDETLAEAAMTVNGFYTDQAWVSGFLQNTNQMWGPGITDAPSFNYGAGLLFGTYLWERGGAPLLSAITHDPAHGFAGLDHALASVGDPLTGFEAFQEMALAVFLNDAANGHGFRSIQLGGSPLPYVATTGTALSETVAPYGLMFVTFDSAATSVEVTTKDEVSAQIVLAGAPDDVESVRANQRFDFTDRTARVLVVTARAPADVSILARD